MPSFALLIAYDGTAFSGWWRQAGKRTVADVLDQAFARLGEPSARAQGASRTDAGVHARGQVARVDVARTWTADEVWRGLAAHLPGDCSCRAVAAVAEAWHPVHHASGKTYSYRIDNGAVADPFAAGTAWRPPFRLDLTALQRAAAPIAGRRDWRGFARRGDHRDDLVRTLSAVDWRADGDALVCSLAGDGFTYRLARSLVGAMVAVANGGCSTGELASALAGRPSPAGRQQAPARGLCLEQVHYRDEPGWEP